MRLINSTIVFICRDQDALNLLRIEAACKELDFEGWHLTDALVRSHVHIDEDVRHSLLKRAYNVNKTFLKNLDPVRVSYLGAAHLPLAGVCGRRPRNEGPIGRRVGPRAVRTRGTRRHRTHVIKSHRRSL